MSARRSQPVSPPVTLVDAVEVWQRHWRGEAQHVIAAALSVNQGRISEIPNGQRFPEAKSLASSKDDSVA